MQLTYYRVKEYLIFGNKKMIDLNKKKLVCLFNGNIINEKEK
jgi:hypothetical protein